MPSMLESGSLPLSTASEEVGTPRTISGLNGAAQAMPWPPSSQPQQPQTELVQAVNLVARAVQGRIAVLQAEIDQLRRALHPFKQMGQMNQDAFVGGDDAVNELLAIARKLGGPNAS